MSQTAQAAERRTYFINAMQEGLHAAMSEDDNVVVIGEDVDRSIIGATRGLIDDTGRVREKQLLAKISSIRGKAIIQPEGRAPYPSLRRRRRGALAAYPPPSYPGPAGLGGNYPAPSAFPAPAAVPQGAPAAASAPLGHSATQYSEVDPTWKPPGE